MSTGDLHPLCKEILRFLPYGQSTTIASLTKPLKNMDALDVLRGEQLIELLFWYEGEEQDENLNGYDFTRDPEWKIAGTAKEATEVVVTPKGADWQRRDRLASKFPDNKRQSNQPTHERTSFLELIKRLPSENWIITDDAADAQITTVAILAAKEVDRHLVAGQTGIVALLANTDYRSPRMLDDEMRPIYESLDPPQPLPSQTIDGLALDNYWLGAWWTTFEEVRAKHSGFASKESFGGRKTSKNQKFGNVTIGTFVIHPVDRWRDRACDFRTALQILAEIVGEEKIVDGNAGLMAQDERGGISKTFGVESAITTLKEAFARDPSLKDKKPNDVIRAAHIAQKTGRKALRALEANNEYSGFSRPTPSRFKK